MRRVKDRASDSEDDLRDSEAFVRKYRAVQAQAESFVSKLKELAKQIAWNEDVPPLIKRYICELVVIIEEELALELKRKPDHRWLSTPAVVVGLCRGVISPSRRAGDVSEMVNEDDSWGPDYVYRWLEAVADVRCKQVRWEMIASRWPELKWVFGSLEEGIEVVVRHVPDATQGREAEDPSVPSLASSSGSVPGAVVAPLSTAARIQGSMHRSTPSISLTAPLSQETVGDGNSTMPATEVFLPSRPRKGVPGDRPDSGYGSLALSSAKTSRPSIMDPGHADTTKDEEKRGYAGALSTPSNSSSNRRKVDTRDYDDARLPLKNWRTSPSSQATTPLSSMTRSADGEESYFSATMGTPSELTVMPNSCLSSLLSTTAFSLTTQPKKMKLKRRVPRDGSILYDLDTEYGAG